MFDCLAGFETPDALAIADAALRAGGMSPRGLVEFLRAEFRGHRGVRRAARVATLADARAESGGESIARATMCALGFALPELQVWIEDPVEPGMWFRVDFLWLCADGSIIIGELDGRQKTTRPELMGGRDALRVMQDERLREAHLTALHPRDRALLLRRRSRPGAPGAAARALRRAARPRLLAHRGTPR